MFAMSKVDTKPRDHTHLRTFTCLGQAVQAAQEQFRSERNSDGLASVRSVTEGFGGQSSRVNICWQPA